MTTETMIAIVGVVITVVGAIGGHLCFSVWWASKITTTLDFLKGAAETIAGELKEHKASAFSKEDAVRHATYVKDQIDALSKRQDENRERIEALERELAAMKGRA